MAGKPRATPCTIPGTGPPNRWGEAVLWLGLCATWAELCAKWDWPLMRACCSISSLLAFSHWDTRSCSPHPVSVLLMVGNRLARQNMQAKNGLNSCGSREWRGLVGIEGEGSTSELA